MRKQGQSQEEYCKGCILRNVCNVILEDDESCEDRYQDPVMSELVAVVEGCRGYLEGLPVAWRPDDEWFKPLIAAIDKARMD